MAKLTDFTLDTGNELVAETTGSALAVPLNYDYSQIPAEHRAVVEQAAADIKRRERRAAQDIVEIGRSLRDVQARLEHGQFLPWLDQEFGWERRMAYNFMAVADKVENFANLENFGLSALYLLSGPNVPDEAIEKANEIAASGAKVTHRTAKELLGKPKSPAEVAGTSQRRGKCEVCGRSLTDPKHIAQGCGPVCAGKRRADADEMVSKANSRVVYVEPVPEPAPTFVPPEPDEDDEPRPGGIRVEPSPALMFGHRRQREKRERLAAWESVLLLAEHIGDDTGDFSFDRELRRLIELTIRRYREQAQP